MSLFVFLFILSLGRVFFLVGAGHSVQFRAADKACRFTENATPLLRNVRLNADIVTEQKRGNELKKAAPLALGLETGGQGKAPCGDRTRDHTLTKRMLYQLS